MLFRSAVTAPVPKRLVRRSLRRLEVIVPALITVDTIPANDSGTPSSGCIVGHAAPSSESGSPRLIKLTYIIVISNAIILQPSFFIKDQRHQRIYLLDLIGFDISHFFIQVTVSRFLQYGIYFPTVRAVDIFDS